jgi:hypothetical protein
VLALLGINQRVILLLPFRETAGAKCFVLVFFEDFHGASGSTTVVAGGDDQLAFRYLREATLELVKRHIDISLESAQFFELLGFTDVKEEYVLPFKELFQLVDGKLFRLEMARRGFRNSCS